MESKKAEGTDFWQEVSQEIALRPSHGSVFMFERLMRRRKRGIVSQTVVSSE